jgi:hypothetical protein
VAACSSLGRPPLNRSDSLVPASRSVVVRARPLRASRSALRLRCRLGMRQAGTRASGSITRASAEAMSSEDATRSSARDRRKPPWPAWPSVRPQPRLAKFVAQIGSTSAIARCRPPPASVAARCQPPPPRRRLCFNRLDSARLDASSGSSARRRQPRLPPPERPNAASWPRPPRFRLASSASARARRPRRRWRRPRGPARSPLGGGAVPACARPRRHRACWISLVAARLSVPLGRGAGGVQLFPSDRIALRSASEILSVHAARRR